MIGSNPVYDAFDRIMGKLPDVLVDGALSLLAGLARPLATLTESFYLLDMGERYFTLWNAVGGLLLLAFFFGPAALPAVLPQYMLLPPDPTMFGFISVLGYRIILSAWAMCIVLRAVWQIIAATRRDAQGLRLHSYSCGRPPFDLGKPSYYASAIALLGIFLMVPNHPWSAPLLGGTLFMSSWASLAQRTHEYRVFRRRMLDTLDAQIEQENLDNAVMKRFPKSLTEGLGVPMRASTSNKIRRDFIRGMRDADYTRPTATKSALVEGAA